MKSNIAAAVAKNLAWLESMHQPKGYAGPVVHYWQDCLRYIGPSMNWCYEGLIAAYIALYKKTQDKAFLSLMYRAGNELINNQMPNGAFFNSHFENNPSLARGGTPHDTAAALGLAYLAEFLKKQKRPYEQYLVAAKKSLDEYHIKRLYDAKTGLFFQYLYDRQHLHIPNKIATLLQLMILVDKLTEKKQYASYIERNAEYILEMQDNDCMNGGIYQTEKRDRIIVYYTARCIPALLETYEITKKKKYLDAAKKAGAFIKRMRSEEGGYSFGYMLTSRGWKLFKYPIFVAGSGDITRALLLLEGKTKIVEEDVAWLGNHQLPSGGIMTSKGMNLKDKQNQELERQPFWRDVIPVVGWNDKALRLFSDIIPARCSFQAVDSEPYTVACADGAVTEDAKRIIVRGKESYVFSKAACFSSNDKLMRVIMRRALKRIGSRSDRNFDVKVYDYLLKHGFSMKPFLKIAFS